MIDIKGLNKAEVLKALYDGSHIQGMGFMQAVPEGTVTVEHCKMLLETTGYPYFDYLYGRVLKVDLSKDVFDERLYDRDNGQGAAERIIRLDLTRLKIEFASDAGREFPHSIMIRFGDIHSVDVMIAALEETKIDMAGGCWK